MVEKGKIFLHLTPAKVRSEIERCINLPTSLHLMRAIECLLVEPHHFDLFSFWTLEANAKTDRAGVLLCLQVSLC